MVANHDTHGPNIYANDKTNDIASNTPTAERDGASIPTHDSTGYSIREQPYGTLRPIRVIVMGAGASTLNFLKKAEEQMKNLTITVYEKVRHQRVEVVYLVLMFGVEFGCRRYLVRRLAGGSNDLLGYECHYVEPIIPT